jgi:hypothetical protein
VAERGINATALRVGRCHAENTVIGRSCIRIASDARQRIGERAEGVGIVGPARQVSTRQRDNERRMPSVAGIQKQTE